MNEPWKAWIQRRTSLCWVMSGGSCVPLVPPDLGLSEWKAGDDRASETGLIIRAI